MSPELQHIRAFQSPMDQDQKEDLLKLDLEELLVVLKLQDLKFLARQYLAEILLAL